jgi:hypothetical protein
VIEVITFNGDCIRFFPETAFVEILLHPAERILAVRPAEQSNKNAVLWNTKPIAANSICKNIRTICGWDKKINYKVLADCFTRKGKRVLMFDLGSAEYLIREQIEKLTKGANGEDISIWKDVSKLLQPENWQNDFGRDVISHATTCRRWLARSLENWEVDRTAESVKGFDNYESILTEKEILLESDINDIFAKYPIEVKSETKKAEVEENV